MYPADTLPRKNISAGLTLRIATAASVVALAGGVTIAVQQFGAWAVGALPAILGGLLLLEHPVLAVYSMVIALPVEALLNLDGELPTVKLLGGCVAGAWFLHRLATRQEQSFGRGCRIVFPASLLLFFSAASAGWATYPRDTLLPLATLLLMIVWYLVVRDLINSWHRVRTLAICLVSSAAVGACLTAKQYFVDGVARAGDGIAGGVNGTGAVLVSVLPFAAVLLRRQEPRLVRVLAAGTLAISLVGIVVTFSRTSAVLTCMLFLLPLFKQAGRRRRSKALLLFVATIVAGVFLSWEPAQERMANLKPGVVNMWEAVANSRANVDSRGYHLRIGWAMFMDSPVVGVGYGNYPRQFRERYQFSVLGSEDYYGALRSPHSSYTGLLAETGVIGLTIWLVCVGLAFLTAITAWLGASGTERTWIEVIGASLLVQTIYGMSAPVHQEKFIWMLFGLCSATLALVQQRRGTLEAPALGGAVGGTRVTLPFGIGNVRIVVKVPNFVLRLFGVPRAD